MTGADEMLKNNVTAIFACTDAIALGVCRRLWQLGLRIPDDISLAGYDNIDLPSISSPAVTTVSQPARKLGREAAGMIIDCLENGKPMEDNRFSNRNWSCAAARRQRNLSEQNTLIISKNAGLEAAL
jgi:DNA-binding LacI/PurR family transcriptional regulator